MSPLSGFLLVVRYIRALRGIEPAVLLRFTPKPNIFGSMAASALGVPIINNVTGLGTAFIHGGILVSWFPVFIAWHCVDRIACSSRSTANHSGDSPMVERAARNFHRAATTVGAMHRIAELRTLSAELVARSKLHQWQSSLYRGGASVPAYLRILPLLAKQGLLLRESVRRHSLAWKA